MRTPLAVRGTEVVPASRFHVEGNVLTADAAKLGIKPGRWPEVLIVCLDDDRLGFQFDSAEENPETHDLRWVRYVTARRQYFVTLFAGGS